MMLDIYKKQAVEIATEIQNVVEFYENYYTTNTDTAEWLTCAYDADFSPDTVRMTLENLGVGEDKKDHVMNNFQAFQDHCKSAITPIFEHGNWETENCISFYRIEEIEAEFDGTLVRKMLDFKHNTRNLTKDEQDQLLELMHSDYICDYSDLERDSGPVTIDGQWCLILNAEIVDGFIATLDLDQDSGEENE